MSPASNSNLVELIRSLILLVVALLLWGGHFFPWHIIPAIVEPTGKRQLKRMFAYAYGVGIIWLGALGFSWINNVLGQGMVINLIDLTTVIVAAGIGTALPRLVKLVRDVQVDLSEKRNGTH